MISRADPGSGIRGGYFSSSMSLTASLLVETVVGIFVVIGSSDLAFLVLEDIFEGLERWMRSVEGGLQLICF